MGAKKRTPHLVHNKKVSLSLQPISGSRGLGLEEEAEDSMTK